VRENGLVNGAYIRPIAYRGYGEMGVAGNIEQPASVSVAAWEWGSYLGEGGLDQGVDVCVSSWQRVAPNTVPALAKAGGNYLSSALVTLEARRLGFTEGIALNTAGFVSEGAGENLFLVQDGKLYTPPVASSILSGITRNTVMRLAEAAGIPVLEQNIPRELLYIADEVFLTGTAAEITPVRSVDKIPVGEGKRAIRRQHGRSLELARADYGSKGRPLAPRRGLEERSCSRCSEKSGARTSSCPRPMTHPRSCTSICICCTRSRRRRRSTCCARRVCRYGAPIAAWRRSITRRRRCRSRR
jgi:branched-subunit amino acid aminotransferase/4-amino-4-deoxychorismate lyase